MKTSVHSDLLFPSITNDYYTEIGRDPLWEQKKYNQVLWRGETTGAYHAKGTGWRQTQRARLVQREFSHTLLDSSPLHRVADATSILSIFFPGRRNQSRMNRRGRSSSTSPTPLLPIPSASCTRPRKTSSRCTLTSPIPARRSSAAQRTRRASSCSAITASTAHCWPTKRTSTNMCWTSTPTMLVASSNDSCASFWLLGIPIFSSFLVRSDMA